MGAQSSKTRSGSISLTLPINDASLDHTDLSSYEAACQNDPDLMSFDATIHERTTKVLNSLANNRVDNRALSFDALVGVIDCQYQMNQDVAKFILKSNEDVWKNKEMFKLVEKYFDNSLKTLDFCAALLDCLRRTRDSQMIVGLAVKQFEEETKNGADAEGKYEKTLKELRKFKEAGDPFTEGFVHSFQQVCEQHLKLFNDLQKEKRKLDKKLKSYKTWKKVSNAIFVAAFASVLIFSVVAAALAAPPVVVAIAAALALPMGPVGNWCRTLWNGYIKEVTGQRKLLIAVQGRTYIVLKEFETIRTLVYRLEEMILSMLESTNFALREEDHSVTLVIGEIMKNLEEFNRTIENLFQHASKCSHDVTMARTVILRHIESNGDGSSASSNSLW